MPPHRGPLSSLKALRDKLANEARALEEERLARAALKEATDREVSLFRDHVKDVRPLAGSGRYQQPLTPVAPLAHQLALDEKRALAESLSDEFDPESLLETDDRLSWSRVGIGSDIIRKLRRGEWVIQDEVDLHGARRDEAREMVAEFLRTSIKRGLRCVRVIHGKGLGSAGGQPILKARVRSWLMQKDEVLAFCQAQAKDGGSGALIVLLRPTRPT
jgi:DNA-nicking Smr family endonuclease